MHYRHLLMPHLPRHLPHLDPLGRAWGWIDRLGPRCDWPGCRDIPVAHDHLLDVRACAQHEVDLLRLGDSMLDKLESMLGLTMEENDGHHPG
jgi:hypothetical protein